MLSSKKKCSFFSIDGHRTAMGMDQENTLSFNIIAAISIVCKLNQNTNTKKMFNCLKKLLNGKCQRQNSSDILAFWRSLQMSVKKLSKSEMERLLSTFVANLLGEGMQHDGTINVFKIPDIFIETCKLFIASFETDDGPDTVMKENANLKNSVSTLHEQPSCETTIERMEIDKTSEINTILDTCMTQVSFLHGAKLAREEPMAETANVAQKRNSPCSNHLSPTVNRTNLNDETTLGNLAEWNQVQELEASVFTGECAMQACAGVMPSKACNQAFNITKEHTMGDTMQACGVLPSQGKKTKEHKKEKNAKKVSLASEVDAASSMGGLQVHGASVENNSIKTQEEGFLPSEKEPSLESRKKSHKTSAKKQQTRKPQKESKVSCPHEQSSCEKAVGKVANDAASELNGIRDPYLSQGSLFTEGYTMKEPMQACGFTSGKEKTFASSGANTDCREDVAASGENQREPKKSRKPEKESSQNKLSVQMQAPWSYEPEPISSKPVQDELTERDVEIHRLQGELFKTRKKVEEVQNKYQIEMAEALYHKEMNVNLVDQIRDYVTRLKRLEELYYSSSNPTL